MTTTERARKMIAGMRADGWDMSTFESLLTEHQTMLDALERIALDTSIHLNGGVFPSDMAIIAREAVEKVRKG